MIVYLRQCYPLNLSHPLLLPLCPQVCPLHLNLCSYPANRFISTIFLIRFVYTNQCKRNQIYENKTLPLIEYIPPGSSVHGIFQARGTGVVKNLPAMQETWVRSLGWEDPLENAMDRGPWRATVHGVSRVGHDLVTKPPLPRFTKSGHFCHEVMSNSWDLPTQGRRNLVGYSPWDCKELDMALRLLFLSEPPGKPLRVGDWSMFISCYTIRQDH